MTDAAQHIEKTARELEWHELLQCIAKYCAGEVAAGRLGSRLPCAAREDSVRQTRMAEEVMALWETERLPARAIPNHDQKLAELMRGRLLDGSELVEVLRTLEAASELQRYLQVHASQLPVLGSELPMAASLRPLLERLSSCLGPDGQLLDSATPALSKRRRAAYNRRVELKERLSQIMASLGEAMQGQYLVEREGRYVLPIRADAPFRVEGLVLGSSASGGTLYVEPFSARELGNSLQQAEADVRTEEARVLRELCEQVREHSGDILALQEACLFADQLQAIAHFSVIQRATPLEVGPQSTITLLAMRHPLLGLGADVVPNDLQLKAGEGLVISGPNAGGKTVALKCLGLAVWMARSGIPVPAAEGSVIGWFDEVLCDIGDNQSLSQSLSTFSAHMRHMASCLDRCSARTLILVDELSGGTDPDEGAALAAALLEGFLERGAAVCITTHYEKLKSLAAEHPQLRNAAVGFDRQLLVPTFQLRYGAAGASSAFLVAERHGVTRPVLERAVALLPQALVRVRALTEELETRIAELQSESEKVRDEERAVRQLRFELEGEQRRALAEERRRIHAETQTVLEEVREARSRLNQAQKRLRKGVGVDSEQLLEARSAASALGEFVAIGGKLRKAAQSLTPSDAAAQREPLSWDSVRVGQAVRVISLGTEAEVTAKPRRGKLELRIGSMKAVLDSTAVELTGKGKPPAAAKPASPKRETTERSASVGSIGDLDEANRTEDNTVNLRGQRVEDGLLALDEFLEQLSRDDLHVGFILHGHGTGALKAAVRKHLQGHRRIKQAKPATPEQGGDAFTVFVLR